MTKNPLPKLPIEEELLWLDVEDALFDMQESGRQLDEAWEEFRKGNVPADLHDDAPLKLEAAVCLPELAGVYTVNAEFREKSESVTVKTLRLAIDRGQLAVIRPNEKNLYVTRRAIREWLETCLGQKTIFRSSSSERNAEARTAKSLTRRNTSSMTTTANTSLESARMILNQLKQPSANTSPKNTRQK